MTFVQPRAFAILAAFCLGCGSKFDSPDDTPADAGPDADAGEPFVGDCYEM